MEQRGRGSGRGVKSSRGSNQRHTSPRSQPSTAVDAAGYADLAEAAPPVHTVLSHPSSPRTSPHVPQEQAAAVRQLYVPEPHSQPNSAHAHDDRGRLSRGSSMPVRGSPSRVRGDRTVPPSVARDGVRSAGTVAQRRDRDASPGTESRWEARDSAGRMPRTDAPGKKDADASVRDEGNRSGVYARNERSGSKRGGGGAGAAGDAVVVKQGPIRDSRHGGKIYVFGDKNDPVLARLNALLSAALDGGQLSSVASLEAFFVDRGSTDIMDAKIASVVGAIGANVTDANAPHLNIAPALGRALGAVCAARGGRTASAVLAWATRLLSSFGGGTDAGVLCALSCIEVALEGRGDEIHTRAVATAHSAATATAATAGDTKPSVHDVVPSASVASIASAMRIFLLGDISAHLLRASFLSLRLLAERYSVNFAPVFRDAVDVLVGWLSDTTTSSEMAAEITALLCRCRQRFAADSMLGITLLDQILADIEGVLSETPRTATDAPAFALSKAIKIARPNNTQAAEGTADAESAPLLSSSPSKASGVGAERASRTDTDRISGARAQDRFIAYCRCFHAIAEGLGDRLHSAVAFSASQGPSGQLVTRLIAAASVAATRYCSWDACKGVNAAIVTCAVHLKHHFAAHAISAAELFLTEPLLCGVSGGKVSDFIGLWADSLRVTAASVGAALPVGFAKAVLHSGSPLVAVGTSDGAEAGQAVAAVCAALMSSRSIACAEYSQQQMCALLDASFVLLREAASTATSADSMDVEGLLSAPTVVSAEKTVVFCVRAFAAKQGPSGTSSVAALLNSLPSSVSVLKALVDLDVFRVFPRVAESIVGGMRRAHTTAALPRDPGTTAVNPLSIAMAPPDDPQRNRQGIQILAPPKPTKSSDTAPHSHEAAEADDSTKSLVRMLGGLVGDKRVPPLVRRIALEWLPELLELQLGRRPRSAQQQIQSQRDVPSNLEIDAPWDASTWALLAGVAQVAIEASADADPLMRVAAARYLSSVRRAVACAINDADEGRLHLNAELARIVCCCVPRLSDEHDGVARAFVSLLSSIPPGIIASAHSKIGTALSFELLSATIKLTSGGDLPAGLLEACIAFVLSTSTPAPAVAASSPPSMSLTGSPFVRVIDELLSRNVRSPVLLDGLRRSLSSRLASAQLALVECARQCVAQRLNVPLVDHSGANAANVSQTAGGTNPMVFFSALERAFREYAALAAKAAEDDSSSARERQQQQQHPQQQHQQHVTQPASQNASTPQTAVSLGRRDRAVLLLSFVGSVERMMFSAAEGCLTVPRALSPASQFFFRMNRRMWTESLSRNRLQMAYTALAAGASASTVFHGFERLAELSEAVKFGPPRERQRHRTEFERCALLVGSALVRLRDADAVAGLAAWARELFATPSTAAGATAPDDKVEEIAASTADPKWLAWVDGALLEAQGKYEAALSAYNTALTLLVAPEGPSANAPNVALAATSALESDPLVAQYLVDRIAECYSRLTDWEGMRRWQTTLQTHRTAPSSAGLLNVQRALKVRRDPHVIKALERFDVADYSGVRGALELAANEHHPDSLCDVSALVSAQQRFLVESMGLIAQHGPSVNAAQQRSLIGNALASARSAALAGLSVSVAESLQEAIPFANGMRLAAAIESVAAGKPLEAGLPLLRDLVGICGGSSGLDPSVHEAGMWNDALRVIRFAASRVPADAAVDRDAGDGVRAALTSLTTVAAKLARKQGNMHLAHRLLLSESATSLAANFERAKLLFARGRHVEAVTQMASVAKKALTASVPSSVVSAAPLTPSLGQGGSASASAALVSAKAYRSLSKWLLIERVVARKRDELLAAVAPAVASGVLPQIAAGLQFAGVGKTAQQEGEMQNGSVAGSDDAVDYVAGACSYLATMARVAGYPKVWAEFAGWCYRRGRRYVERVDDGRGGPGGVDLHSEDERRLRDAVVAAIGDGPVADEMSQRLIRLVQQAPPPPPKQRPAESADTSAQHTACVTHDSLREARLAAMTDVVGAILSQQHAEAAAGSVAQVWLDARDRAMGLYAIAANAYLNYLRTGAGAVVFAREGEVGESSLPSNASPLATPRPSENDADPLADAARTGAAGAAHHVIASLRLLRLVTRHGDELPPAFYESLGLTPTGAWETIVPQMLARMGHADERARTRIATLLVRVAKASPHLMAYPVISELMEEEEAARSLSPGDDGSTRSASGRLSAADLAPLSRALCQQVPTLVHELRYGITELRRLAVLWEEEWTEALYRAQADAIHRLRRLDEDARRVFDNPTLTDGERRVIMLSSHAAVMHPVSVALERVRASTYEQSAHSTGTPHEKRFVDSFAAEIDAALAQLNAPADIRVPSSVWGPFKKLLRGLGEFSQRWRVLDMADVSPRLAAMKDTPLPLPGDASGSAKIDRFDGTVTVLKTKTHPKKIALSANDGTAHSFLLKGTEDLHLDERVMQFLSVINTMLACDSSPNARKYEGGRYALMRARTYAVVPLAAKCGLIRWVDGATPLFALYKAWFAREASNRARDGSSSRTQHDAHMQPSNLRRDATNNDDGPRVGGGGRRRGQSSAAGGRGRGRHNAASGATHSTAAQPTAVQPRQIQLQLARSTSLPASTAGADADCDADERTPDATESAKDEESLKEMHEAEDDAVNAIMPRPADIYFAKMAPALREKGVSDLGDRDKWPRGVARRVYEELLSETPSDLVSRELFCASGSAAHWWESTKSIARTTAVMSVVGYIIGLGDRHLDNILVDLERAEIVHIDYNVCFERGLRLRVPERVPFRLTQNIERAFGHTGCEGVFRLSCERAMATLRRGREALLTLLDAFVYDPLVDWTAGRALEAERRGMELAIGLSLLSTRLAEVRTLFGDALSGVTAALDGLKQTLPAAAVSRQQEVLLVAALADAERESSELSAALEDSVPQAVAELKCVRADVERARGELLSAQSVGAELAGQLAAPTDAASECRAIADAAGARVVGVFFADMEQQPTTLPLDAELARADGVLRAAGGGASVAALQQLIAESDAHAEHRRVCLSRCLQFLQAYLGTVSHMPVKDVLAQSRSHAFASALSELVSCASAALDSNIGGGWHAGMMERVAIAAAAAESTAAGIDMIECDRRTSEAEARLCALLECARERVRELGDAQQLYVPSVASTSIASVKEARDAVLSEGASLQAVYVAATAELVRLRVCVRSEERALTGTHVHAEPHPNGGGADADCAPRIVGSAALIASVPSSGLMAVGKAALSVADVCFAASAGIQDRDAVAGGDYALAKATIRVYESVYEAVVRYDSILLPELMSAVRSGDASVSESLSALCSLSHDADAALACVDGDELLTVDGNNTLNMRKLRGSYAALIRTGIRHSASAHAADRGATGGGGGRVLLAAFDALFASMDKTVRELREVIRAADNNNSIGVGRESCAITSLPENAASDALDDAFFVLKLRSIARCIASARALSSLSLCGPFAFAFSSGDRRGESESASLLYREPVVVYARNMLERRVAGVLDAALDRMARSFVASAAVLSAREGIATAHGMVSESLSTLLAANGAEEGALDVFIESTCAALNVNATAADDSRRILGELAEGVRVFYLGQCHTTALRGAIGRSTHAEDAAASLYFASMPLVARWGEAGPLAQLLQLPVPKTLIESIQSSAALMIQAESFLRAVDERQRALEADVVTALKWSATADALALQQALAARRSLVAAEAERIGSVGWLCDVILRFEGRRSAELSRGPASGGLDREASVAASQLACALRLFDGAWKRLSAAETRLAPIARLVGHDELSSMHLGVVGVVPIELDLGELASVRVAELSSVVSDTGAALASVRRELGETLYPPLLSHASVLATFSSNMELAAREIRPSLSAIASAAEKIDSALAKSVREQSVQLTESLQRIPRELNSLARSIFVEVSADNNDDSNKKDTADADSDDSINPSNKKSHFSTSQEARISLGHGGGNAKLLLRMSADVTDNCHSTVLPVIDELAASLGSMQAALSALASTRVDGAGAVGGAEDAQRASQRDRRADRNAHALGAWKRVKAKLDGRDFDPNRKLTVAQQVDLIIRESRNVDNLAGMFEGWMAWV